MKTTRLTDNQVFNRGITLIIQPYFVTECSIHHYHVPFYLWRWALVDLSLYNGKLKVKTGIVQMTAEYLECHIVDFSFNQ